LFEPEAINYTGIEQETISEMESVEEKPKRRRKKSE
jgi:hypothetical protein